jgi:hypothetical protein
MLMMKSIGALFESGVKSTQTGVQGFPTSFAPLVMSTTGIGDTG